MSLEFEWEMSADSIDLPPLREFSTTSASFYPASSASSAWRPKSSSNMMVHGETLPLRSGSAASRFGVSRRDYCPMEGIPLDQPSKEAQTHELRNKSPRGMAAYTQGRGFYGSCSGEVWRLKRCAQRDPRPLAPLEDTLRKRRVMQLSMSAPVFFGEEVGSPEANRESLQDLYVRNCRRRKRELSEVSTQSLCAQTQSTWTSLEGTSLVDACVRLCDWEDNVSGAQSYWSRLPGGVQPASASPSASSYRGSPMVSPNKGLRQRPLPSELLTRMKDRGWKQTELGKAMWVEQGRQLTSSRSPAPAGAGCRAAQERMQLLQHLEQHAVPQGPEALRAALKWRCGSLEQAFLCLDVSDRIGRSSLSLLEFSGALALMGLHAPALCGGAGETTAFAAFDTDCDGRLSLLDLMGESEPAPSWLSSLGQGGNADDMLEGGGERWIRNVKFVALSAWFATPLLLRHRLRQEASNHLRIDRPETPSMGAMAVVTALAEGATRRASHGAVARQQVSDPVRECWSPSEIDYEEAEGKMKEEFNRKASAKQFSEPLINKSVFFRLLGNIPPTGIGNDPQPKPLTYAQLSELFDEVMALQVQSLNENGITYSKGLTFESFRLALFKVCIGLGLHFRHLVDDAIDAQVPVLLGIGN